MDAYYRYNQIPMVEIDNKNTMFMNNSTIKILIFHIVNLPLILSRIKCKSEFLTLLVSIGNPRCLPS